VRTSSINAKSVCLRSEYLAAYKKPVIIIKFGLAELGEYAEVVDSSVVDEALEAFLDYNTRQVETGMRAKVTLKQEGGRKR
jgi:hypothetical protein